MNKNVKIYFILILLTLVFNMARAQSLKNDTTNIGVVSGLLRDSLHNYVLTSATLSIYKVNNNELVSYQLSNSFGKFQFKMVPVGTSLKIVATHVGYNPITLNFMISPTLKNIDLKSINLTMAEITLNDVVIKGEVPPMQMRGDTLEFNAAAFKLDTNAVMEDLLRKLPGITVWSDGIITVNGRKISKLLVEGKEFFGGNNKIALQNIPTNSIQKVQVYQNQEDRNPLTPKTEMNIVLKDGKKDGLFGKIGLGYGTNKHFAGDGMITYFSPKNQISLVGAINNVNKSAQSVNTLMEFNSFKGEGINNDYHSDFRQPGQNTFVGTGLTLSHDFSEDNDSRKPFYKTNILKGDFLFTNNNNKTIRQSKTLTPLNDNKFLTRNGNSSLNNESYETRSYMGYDKRFEHGYLNGAINYNGSKINSVSTETSTFLNGFTLQQTNSYSKQKDINSEDDFTGTIRAGTERYFDFGQLKNKSVYIDFSYDYTLKNVKNSNTRTTNFLSTDTALNNNFNRNYLNDTKIGVHSINTSFQDIIGLVKQNSRIVKMDIVNSLTISDNNENKNVFDLLNGSKSIYISNEGLSNESHFKSIDEKPGLNFYKDFNKTLTNRYSKYLSVNLLAQMQYFNLKNKARQTFQNINYSYQYFIPTINISFSNEHYGSFEKKYNLQYNTNVQYPSISQLVPIVDYSNVYIIDVGNRNLKPAYNHQLVFTYNYNDEKSKNSMNLDLDITARLVNHNITDSITYDKLERTILGYVNGSTGKYLDYKGSIHKAFKFSEHQIQLTGNSAIGYSKYNLFIKDSYFDAKGSSFSASSIIIYNYKSIWSGGFGEYFSGNKTTQGAFGNLAYHTWTTNFGFAFAYPKSVFFNTRINFNNSKSTATTNNVYYTIWNADVGYRFMKGSQAEIKLSALDILHQNKILSNYVNNNSIVASTSNVLQQYFILTLAYYPRKFGLKK